MLKLNLGCGLDYKKGWVNIDIDKQTNPDKIVNLNKVPYPFEKNSVDEINASHVIEHLTLSPIEFLLECRRILKYEGKLHLRYPNFYFWRNRLKFLKGKLHEKNAFHPEHFQTVTLKPSLILEMARMIGYDIREGKPACGGLSRLLFKNNINLREYEIYFIMRKRGEKTNNKK